MGEWITKVLECMQNNPYIWLFIAVCTILGVPAFFFSIYSQRKSNKKKEITFRKASQIIIGNQVKHYEELKIFYGGQEVKDLSVTEIIIWNSGNKDIRSEDIVSDRPLKIFATSDSRILSAEIVNENEKTNQFRLSETNSNNIKVEFDYVDSNEGVDVRIIHTGNSSNIKLDCKIIGGEEIKQEKESLFEKSLSQIYPFNSFKTRCFFLSLIILVILIVLVMAFLLIIGAVKIDNRQTTVSDLIAFWFVLFVSISVLFCYTKALVSSIKTHRLKTRLFHKN